TAVRDLKKAMVQRYFEELLIQAAVVGENPTVKAGVRGFSQARQRGVGSVEWEFVEAQVGPYLQRYVAQYGYRSLYLIHPDGSILYTTTKESDMGENLLTGYLQTTNLAQGFRRALEQPDPLITDMAFYPPADNLPLMFVLQAVLDNDGTALGVVALSLSGDELEAIMGVRNGLGRTGETFLVGPD